ncbi:MAG: DsrE family protein [Hylemonella sp.]|nr:DsrE family protein [Hylemonella sp.]MDH5708133.1 DsrE family protein [Hylemonella sp.]
MIRRSTLLLAALVAVSALFTGCASTPDKERVVIQVSDNDPGKWNLALNNAKNVQNVSGGPDKVDVEIVVYGPGIDMLKADSTTANRVNAAIKDGVQVVACENTMRKMKLTKADMNPSISYVPGGVIEIMQRQKQGWAYIRP